MRPEESPSLKVLLVDDHPIVRAGLHTIMTRAGLEIVGEASTAAAAIDESARLEPDVVLMDVRLADGSGVTACREIRAANPAIRVLFLSAFADHDALLATAFASAGGYLLKQIGADSLVQAIRTVATGLSVFHPSVLDSGWGRMHRIADAAGHSSADELLSEQELRVLTLVADGKSNKEIAAAMGLSPKTVKNYLSTVFEKLQVNRRSAAVARMMRGP
jgi:two-component system response regulator DevR